MPDVPHAGKDHHHIPAVSRLDHFLARIYPAGLDTCNRTDIFSNIKVPVSLHSL